MIAIAPTAWSSPGPTAALSLHLAVIRCLWRSNCRGKKPEMLSHTHRDSTAHCHATLVRPPPQRQRASGRGRVHLWTLSRQLKTAVDTPATRALVPSRAPFPVTAAGMASLLLQDLPVPLWAADTTPEYFWRPRSSCDRNRGAGNRR